MSKPVGVCLVGEGAMGQVHAETLAKLPGVRIAALAGADPEATRDLAERWGAPFWSLNIAECLARPDVDAVVVASPSPVHVDHAVMAAQAGKPALVEIPLALSLADGERAVKAAEAAGTPLMLAHTRRFSPAHRRLKAQMRAGAFHLHHLVSETYFLRRTNLNMFGKPRTWKDSLLWHHACHTVDLFLWLTDDPQLEAWGQRGPLHPDLGIPMDLTIGLRSPRSGALASLALSFNNKGPFGGFYRYIGEEETFRVFRDALTDSEGAEIPLEGAAFADQDRAFIEAVRSGAGFSPTGEEALASLLILDRLDRMMEGAAS